MGQEITVTRVTGTSPSVMIFDCNRSITGMAIERYTSVDDTTGGRPPDVLARRLFDLGATPCHRLLERGDRRGAARAVG